jgi:hypothetical protein
LGQSCPAFPLHHLWVDHAYIDQIHLHRTRVHPLVPNDVSSP